MLLNYNIISSKSSVFKKIEQLYVDSFPPDERRELSDFEKITSECNCFSVLEVETASGFAGFLSFWRLQGCVYIEHFAISPALRNSGIGEQVLKDFQARVGEPVIFEVEPPLGDTARRRISFYQRNGFSLWEDIDYVQPPYGHDRQALPMRLMTMGFTSTRQVASAVGQIRKMVYRLAEAQSSNT